MKVSEIMSKRVVSGTPGMSVYDAAKKLSEYGISGMPVLDSQGHLVGIVTESDLYRRVEVGTEHAPRSKLKAFFTSTRQLAREYLKEHAFKLSDVMTHEVITADEAADVVDAADLLEKAHIKRLPVMSGRTVVGIISRANLVQALSTLSRNISETQTTDIDLRDRAVAALAKYPWSLPQHNVIIQNGIVHVWGTIHSEEERAAIRVTIEHIAGVKGFHDHLSYPETFGMI